MRNVKLLALSLMIIVVSSCNKESLTPEREAVAWMSDLLDKYPKKDILFSDICLPGSHDAGMYTLKNCSFGANECNTKTQHLNTQQQLAAGYRYFDIRPTILGGKFYTFHFNECGGLGCYGDRLENILQSIQEFIKSHKEIILIQLDHFCKLTPDDESLYELFNNTFGENLYKETFRVEDFYDWSLRKILGDNGQGKVILTFKTQEVPNTDDYRRKGYFNANILNKIGGWSDKNEYSDLKKDQLKNFDVYQSRPPYLFEFSWQMTHDALDAVACALGNKKSIRSMSEISNPDFQIVIDSLIQVGVINTHKIPNFFWVDYGDDWMIDVAKKISEIKIKN